MGVRKILLSSACLAMLANASTWEDKYNDILARAEQVTSENEKAALLKQAQEYEKAKNAETYMKQVENTLKEHQGIVNDKQGAYNTQLGSFNQFVKNVNDKNLEKQQANDTLASVNKQLLDINNQTTQYQAMKDDYENKNNKLTSDIASYTSEKNILEAKLLEKQTAQTAQQSIVTTKKSELETIKKEHFALVDKYNKDLIAAENIKTPEIEELERQIDASDDKIELAMQEHKKAEADLNAINSEINSINNNKLNLDNAIKNAENIIANNNLKKSDLEQKLSQNTIAAQGLEKNISDTKLKISNLENEIATLTQEKDKQEQILEQKLSELNTAKAELEQSKIQLEDAKNALDEAILAISGVADKKNQIEKSMGELASSAKDEVKDLVLFMATNPDLSNPSDKAKVQAVADRVADAVLEKEKSNATISSSGATLVQLNNMTKRLGEVRGFDAKVGAWVRGYGGKYSSDDSHFYYYSTQIGADNMLEAGYNARVLVGGLIGFDKINANTKTKSYSVGGYASYLHDNGSFLDVVLKYVNTSHEKLNHSLKDQNSVLLSVEAGHRFGIYDFYIEPSVELISGYVSKYEDKIGKKTELSINSYSPLLLKPQVFVGGISDSFVYRVGVGAVLDTQNQKANVSIDDIVSGINASSSTKLDKNSYGFASVGGSYKINDKFIVNLGLERSFGGKLTNDYEINTTIRYGF